jgi:hypothetical protein
VIALIFRPQNFPSFFFCFSQLKNGLNKLMCDFNLGKGKAGGREREKTVPRTFPERNLPENFSGFSEKTFLPCPS